MKLIDLQNHFADFKKEQKLPDNIQLHLADARLGKRAAIVSMGETGTMSIEYGYSSYTELSAFIDGIYIAKKQYSFLNRNEQ